MKNRNIKLPFFSENLLIFRKSTDPKSAASEEITRVLEPKKEVLAKEAVAQAQTIRDTQQRISRKAKEVIKSVQKNPILEKDGQYELAYQRYLRAKGMNVEGRLGIRTRLDAEEYFTANKRLSRINEIQKRLEELSATSKKRPGYVSFTRDLSAAGEDPKKIEVEYKKLLLIENKNEIKIKRKQIEDFYSGFLTIGNFLDYIEFNVELNNLERELGVLQVADALILKINEIEKSGGGLDVISKKINEELDAYNDKYNFGEGPQILIKVLDRGTGEILLDKSGDFVFFKPSQNTALQVSKKQAREFDDSLEIMLEKRKLKAPVSVPRPSPEQMKKRIITKKIEDVLALATKAEIPRPTAVSTLNLIASRYEKWAKDELERTPFKSRPEIDVIEEIKSRILRGKIETNEARAITNLFQKLEIRPVYANIIVNHLADIPLKHLVSIFLDKVDHEKLPALDILADDHNRKLKKDQVELLLEGLVNPHAVRFLELNLNHAELTTDYIQHIFDVEVPRSCATSDGRVISFFDPPRITSGPGRTVLGKGGIGEVYKVFIFEPPEYKATYCALKKGATLYEEPKNAERLIQFSSQGIEIKNLVKPLAVYRGDNEDLIFYEILQYSEETKDAYGRPVTQLKSASLEDLLTDPDVSVVEILTLLTEAIDADLLLGEHDILDMDAKLDNIMKTDRGGVKIDPGSHSAYADIRNFHIRGEPLLEDYDSRKIVKKDPVTGEEKEVEVKKYYYLGRLLDAAVTPGYYNEQIVGAAISGDLPIKAIHNYIYGIMLQRILAGKTPYRIAFRENDGPLQITDDFDYIDHEDAHKFPDMNIHSRILAWAEALMDPTSGVDAKFVNHEIKKILQNYKNKV